MEAGTGFYEQRFLRKEIEPSMGRVEITKTDPGGRLGKPALAILGGYVQDHPV